MLTIPSAHAKTVCTVAARYYTKRKDDLYRKCLRIAKRIAFDVMTKGYKSNKTYLVQTVASV